MRLQFRHLCLRSGRGFVRRMLLLSLSACLAWLTTAAPGQTSTPTPTPLPVAELEARLARAQEARGRLDALLALLEVRRQLKAPRALEVAVEAEALARQLQDRPALARALQAHAALLLNQERYKDSLTKRREALELFRQLGNATEVMIALQWIGRSHFSMGDYSEAETALLESLKMAREQREGLRESQLLNSLGILRDARGDYEGAVRYLLEAIAVGQRLNDAPAVIMSRVNLGTTFRHQDRHQDALAQYQLAESIAPPGDVYIRAVLANNSGDAYTALGQYDRAVAAQDIAMQAARKLGSQEIMAAARESLGATRQAMGQLEQALAEYHEALQIYRAVNIREGIIKSLNRLGSVQLARGEPAGAIAYASEALSLAEGGQRPDGVKAAAETLVRAHRQLGDLVAAFTYADQLAVVTESLRGVEARKRVAELEARFQSAQSARQIELLKAESEVQRLELLRQDRLRTELIAGLIVLAGGLALLWNRFRLKRQGEEALRRQNEELVEARQRAEAANRAKSEFLANMSHEIRTPMNSILGFAEVLGGRVQGPEDREYLGAISSSGQTLLRLINDILDLSKIESGKLELQPIPTDVAALLQEVRQMFSLQAQQKGIGLELALDAALPPELVLDEVRLRQILVNTVGNALKFTERGGVIIRANASSTPPGGDFTLTIEVVDTGIGIPEAERARVFEAFSQVSGQSTRRYGGTGLGLAITQRLVEMMNGRITLQSEVGRGSTFRFDFPGLKAGRGTQSARVAARDGQMALERAFAALEPLDVVVIDDVPLNRRLVADFLGPRHRTREAADIAAGLGLIRAQTPDLVITDLRMPGGSGEDLIRQLRADPALAHVPVLVLTASAPEGGNDILTPENQRLLRKPVSRSELIAEVGELVIGSAGHRGLRG